MYGRKEKHEPVGEGQRVRRNEWCYTRRAGRQSRYEPIFVLYKVRGSYEFSLSEAYALSRILGVSLDELHELAVA